MFNDVLINLDIIAHLGLAGMLVFLCFRTRSKGLILISAILLTSGIFSWMFDQVGALYVDRSVASEMSGDGTQHINAGEFLITLSLIEDFLYKGLCILGGFLIYREWRQGKFVAPSVQPTPSHTTPA